MKVVTDNSVFPPRKHYEDVELKFTKFTPKCRVLPANYFEEPNTHFILKARYEPGENKFFPMGGFEVKHSEGGTYNYYLDEVIVHPYELGMNKFFTKAPPEIKEKVKDPNAPKGKRGRKALDPEVKAAKEATKLAEAEERRKRSGGKRGRPKKS